MLPLLSTLSGGGITILGVWLTQSAQRDRDDQADARRLRDERRERLRQTYLRAYMSINTYAQSVYFHRHVDPLVPELHAAETEDLMRARREINLAVAELEMEAGAEAVFAAFQQAMRADQVRQAQYHVMKKAGLDPLQEPGWQKDDNSWLEARTGLLNAIRVSLRQLEEPPAR